MGLSAAQSCLTRVRFLFEQAYRENRVAWAYRAGPPMHAGFTVETTLVFPLAAPQRIQHELLNRGRRKPACYTDIIISPVVDTTRAAAGKCCHSANLT